MARVVVFYKVGTADVLKIEERPNTKPKADEVLLGVHAIGLNRAELAFRSGRYLDIPQTFPAGLGLEAAGIIEQVGAAVEGFAVGQPVATLPVFSMCDYGVYGDSVLVPANALTAYPDRLSSVEAASVWMSSLTAYGGLLYSGKLEFGDFALITAASSSVGTTAIQVAKAIGAKVIATTRSAIKKQKLLEIGADFVIVTNEEDLVTRVAEITSGSGADVCFDAVGGGMVSKLMQVAAFGARIVVYGTLSTELTVLPLLMGLKKCAVLHAYRNQTMMRFPDERRKALQFVFDGLANGSIAPIIDRVLPLERVADAHRAMESNEHFGKIILVTDRA